MKTILVLTDFSVSADYAAHYALKLAQMMKADLLLCNIYESPAAPLIEAHTGFPFSTPEEDSMNDLGELAARLKTAAEKASATNFKPEITQCSLSGTLAGGINQLVSQYELLMAVISGHGAGILSNLFSTNHAREIIENAVFPVLIVPYQARFSRYRNIAFATSKNVADFKTLQTLTDMALAMEAEIWVTHITTQADTLQEEKELIHFFSRVAVGLGRALVRYRVIRSHDTTAGLLLLSSERDTDLLVLVHRKRNFLQQIFNGSITHQLMQRPFKPILVYPRDVAG